MDHHSIKTIKIMNNLLDLKSDIRMKQFFFFRIIFGLYLSWHFAALIPYAGEIFSCEGILGASGLNPFEGKWPNPFFLWGSPPFVQISLALGVVVSLLFAADKFRRSSALFLWFLHSCLFTANPLTANPSLGYVGILLLLCVVTPTKFDRLPRMIPLTAWILLAAGYSFSGFLKLGSPSWIDGSALHHLMSNPLARPGMARDLMLSLPESFLQIMTWSTLALEVLFIPLCLFRKTRFFAWSAMLLMHIGIMFTVDFADLSLGMLMVHLFTVQPSWITAGRRRSIRFYQAITAIAQRRKVIRACQLILVGLITCTFISACSTQTPHQGLFPFSMMEKPPSQRSVTRKVRDTNQTPQQMQPIVRYDAATDRSQYQNSIAVLRPGDVVAFYMSHADARVYLKQRKIQKVPYELFRFGHVSVLVPNPTKPHVSSKPNNLRLLQVAMKQAVTADDTLAYLRDKSWIAYRPPSGSIDAIRLHNFAKESTRKCSSPENAYDFRATFGIANGNLTPDSLTEIRDQYTCATLIVAALSYSGFDLHAVKRNGHLDILTPRQVTNSWGVVRMPEPIEWSNKPHQSIDDKAQQKN